VIRSSGLRASWQNPDPVVLRSAEQNRFSQPVISSRSAGVFSIIPKRGFCRPVQADTIGVTSIVSHARPPQSVLWLNESHEANRESAATAPGCRFHVRLTSPSVFHQVVASSWSIRRDRQVPDPYW